MSTIRDYLDLVPWWAVLIVGLATVIYEYLTWHFGYWEKQGVKGAKPRPVFGTFASPSEQKSVEDQDGEAYKKYGRVCGIYEGRKPALLVGEPELLRIVLVKDFHAFQNRRSFSDHDDTLNKGFFQLKGEDWKVLRNVTAPTYSPGKMKQMVMLIEECAEQLVNHLEKFAESGDSFEAKDWMASYALDVVATCAFGIKVDSVRDRNSKFVQYAKKAFGDPPKWFFMFFLIPEWVKRYLPSVVSTEAVAYLTQVVQNVINARKRDKTPRRDLLQLLLEAKEEAERELEANETEEKKNIAEIKRKVLATDYICAQSVVTLTAGLETATTTLSFALYYLATNEPVQERLFKEIEAVLVHKYKNKVTYELLADMHYMDMVVSEVLRITPPAGRFDRMCTEDGYVLDGITLKKGMVIAVPVYAIHHDSDFYPDPEVFDPERFSSDNRNNRDPLTYLPFGYGPRNCIGMRFALMEVKMCLTYLLRDYKVKTCPETEIPFVRKPNTIFFEPNTIMVRLEKRIPKM